MVWGALIGAGASLAGGFMNQASSDAARRSAEANAQGQQRLQEIFAQTGITWRAHDVMKAYKETGIHPLSLLGVNAPTYSPVSVVGGGGSGVGDAISSAGQGLGRAIDATASEDRRLAHAGRLDRLVMERAGLENDLLRMRIASELAQMKQNANPSMPIGNRWLVEGQGNAPAGAVVNKVMERIGPGANVTAEPGAVTDVGFSRTPSGWAPTRSKDLQDRAEDDAVGSVTWNIRNRLLPSLGLDYNAPFPAPAGKRWVYHSARQEYQLIDARRKEGWDPSSPYRPAFGGRR